MNTKPAPVPQTRLVLIEPGVGIALYEGRKPVAFDRSDHVYTADDINFVLAVEAAEIRNDSGRK